MPDSEKFLEEALSKEILINEKLKATLLGAVAIILFVGLSGLLLIFNSFFTSRFETTVPFLLVLGVFVVLGLREFNIRLFIKKRLKSNTPVKTVVRYLNVIGEISVPTVILSDSVSLLQQPFCSVNTYCPFLFCDSDT
jgi:hypothetical protein